MARDAAVLRGYIFKQMRGPSACAKTRARSHCRVAPPLVQFIPDSLTYSVSLYLKRHCDRALHAPRLSLICAVSAGGQRRGPTVSASRAGDLSLSRSLTKHVVGVALLKAPHSLSSRCCRRCSASPSGVFGGSPEDVFESFHEKQTC